jgi:hypothetical protein
VLDEARRSAVTVFTILPSADDEVQPQLLRRPRITLFEMRQLAEDTGGRAFTPTGHDDLASIYDAIAGELGQQYWLAYMPAPTGRPGFRRVSVRIETRPELLARTRTGYYAGRSRPDVQPSLPGN